MMNYPRHVAIIADGNRTRAKEQWLPSMDWHFAWAKKTIELFEYIFEHTPINVVTWWFLSTENLKWRSPEEVAFIFYILQILGNDMDEFMKKYHINFRWIWNSAGLPENTIQFLQNKEKNFSFPDSPKTIVFAINYGWRDEIIRWIKNIPKDKIDTLNEDDFGQYLDLWNIEPVELVIRTKWDKAHRTSWFMARWIWYAELYFAKDYYPGLTTEKLEESFRRFDSIAEDRNYGK